MLCLLLPTFPAHPTPLSRQAMTRRSRAARPEARAPGGNPGGAQLDEGVPPAGNGSASEAHVAPPSVAPRWPASVYFRWEEKAGPRDVWDSLPFPQEGAGVFGRLRAAAAGCKLFRARGAPPAFSLSASCCASGLFSLVPLNDDEDVEKAIGLMGQLCPGTASVLAIAVREEEEAAFAAPAVPRSIGAAVPREPPLPAPPLHGRGDGGPRAARLAPAAAAALGNALPVELWACILNAAASSRCGADAVAFPFLALLAAALSLPLASSSTLRLFVRYCAFLFMPTARRLIHPPR